LSVGNGPTLHYLLRLERSPSPDSTKTGDTLWYKYGHSAWPMLKAERFEATNSHYTLLERKVWGRPTSVTTT